MPAQYAINKPNQVSVIKRAFAFNKPNQVSVIKHASAINILEHVFEIKVALRLIIVDDLGNGISHGYTRTHRSIKNQVRF